MPGASPKVRYNEHKIDRDINSDKERDKTTNEEPHVPIWAQKIVGAEFIPTLTIAHFATLFMRFIGCEEPKSCRKTYPEHSYQHEKYSQLI